MIAHLLLELPFPVCQRRIYFSLIYLFINKSCGLESHYSQISHSQPRLWAREARYWPLF